MRRPMLGLAIVVLGLLAGASTGRAQNTGVFSDPISLYYGLYLPRQQAIASQTTSADIVGAQALTRQESLVRAEQGQRPGLFEEIQPFGLEDLDPTQPFGSRNRGSNRGYVSRRQAIHGAARGSQGPAQHFATAVNVSRYYPSIRQGHSANQNIATTRGSAGSRGRSGMAASGGMGGMGGMGMGGFR